MLDKAKQAAEDERKELTQNARHEVETLRAKWREGLQREKASFLRELKQMAGRQVFDVSRRALKDLADADMEERVITVFLKEIKAMKREARDKMARTIKEDGSKITVRSAFEISSTQRQQITRTLHEQLAGKADVNYEADPEIIFGVELKSGGEKVTWSLGEYLKALEDQTRMALEKETGGGAAEAAETGPAEQKSDGEDTDRQASAEVETKAETERIEQKPEEEAREKSPETEKKKSPKSKGKKKRRKKRK
jgi:F-type H+-transporting ATPase subunit b